MGITEVLQSRKTVDTSQKPSGILMKNRKTPFLEMHVKNLTIQKKRSIDHATEGLIHDLQGFNEKNEDPTADKNAGK